MNQSTHNLESALAELDRLRQTDASRRRENDAVMQALKILAEDEADAKLPKKLLYCLCGFFDLDEAAIVFEHEPLDFGAFSSGIELVQTYPPDAAFGGWQTADTFPALLDGEPRVIGGTQPAPEPLDVSEREGSFLLGTLMLSDVRALLVLYRSAARPAFARTDLNLFLRIMPIVEQALKRQKQGALRDRLESELRDRQKMESLGTLAGGVAHEINTPLQYVMNNLSYLADASGQLLAYSREVRDLIGRPDLERETLPDLAEQKWSEIDGDFLAEDLPGALEQSITGMERISKIVQAIREYSHPAGDCTGEIDIDREIDNALTVSKNQWKYVAEVEMELADGVPTIEGASDHLRQVLINLLVNAGHAIEDRKEQSCETKGLITVRTQLKRKSIVISIGDNGIGMSETVQKRAFDPFYTTKAPGRGTGQGLALCYAMVVQNLGGRIDIESTPGVGTTIHLKLPLKRETALVA